MEVLGEVDVDVDPVVLVVLPVDVVAPGAVVVVPVVVVLVVVVWLVVVPAGGPVEVELPPPPLAPVVLEELDVAGGLATRPLRDRIFSILCQICMTCLTTAVRLPPRRPSL